MPRSIWTGSISFGLVNVPVKVYSAIQEHDVRFHQLSRTGHRIRNKRVDEKTGREIEYDDIVKAYEVSPDNYVEVTGDELEAMKPRATKTIDIEDFVDLADIDPIFFERTYYLGPADNDGAQKAYSLLLAAMTAREKIGVGRVVMRQKEYLAAVRPLGKVLAMSTMLFADEVRDPADVPNLPARAGGSAKEKAMAEQLVESLSTTWNPKHYKDAYQRELLSLIRKKERGEAVKVTPRSEPRTQVVDLMAALEASVAAAKKGGSKALLREVRKPPPAERKDTTAKKPATKRKPRGRAA